MMIVRFLHCMHACKRYEYDDKMLIKRRISKKERKIYTLHRLPLLLFFTLCRLIMNEYQNIKCIGAQKVDKNAFRRNSICFLDTFSQSVGLLGNRVISVVQCTYASRERRIMLSISQQNFSRSELNDSEEIFLLRASIHSSIRSSLSTSSLHRW